MLCPTTMRGTLGFPNGINCLSFSVSPRSQGESQAYQVVGLAAHAITANELSLYKTSTSKDSIDSCGASIASDEPSLLYLVQPLLFIHCRGLSGIKLFANFFAYCRYGSETSRARR